MTAVAEVKVSKEVAEFRATLLDAMESREIEMEYEDVDFMEEIETARGMTEDEVRKLSGLYDKYLKS